MNDTINAPYPKQIGILIFENGEIDVDPYNPNTPPNVCYTMTDIHSSIIQDLIGALKAIKEQQKLLGKYSDTDLISIYCNEAIKKARG